jgi:hypothetical protein
MVCAYKSLDLRSHRINCNIFSGGACRALALLYRQNDCQLYTAFVYAACVDIAKESHVIDAILVPSSVPNLAIQNSVNIYFTSIKASPFNACGPVRVPKGVRILK